MKFFKDVVTFLRNVADDPRIPSRDKKILLVMIALIVSPFDLIPDWIPVFGLLDDLILIALVLDYIFERLDQNILLSHYPWGMKSFARVRRASKLITWMTPQVIRDRIWKYEKDPY